MPPPPRLIPPLLIVLVVSFTFFRGHLKILRVQSHGTDSNKEPESVEGRFFFQRTQPVFIFLL